jgi:molecular chaperone HscB
MQNFFDILGLSPDFALDEKALEKAYFGAQRKTHPDLAIGKPEAERVEAFLKSQLVNEAYETLKNPLSRAEHMLALQNIFVNTEGQKNVAPVLLMEIMELRERLEEAALSGVQLNTVLSEMKVIATESKQTIANAFTFKNYKAAADETARFAYLIKAIEEAHMLIYRLKAAHA